MGVNFISKSNLKRVILWKDAPSTCPKEEVSAQHTEKANDLRKSNGSQQESNHNPYKNSSL